MKILCCYANLHPETECAVAAHAKDAEFIDVSGSELDYWRTIKAHWTGDQDLVIIEQDIEITAEVIPTFEGCDDAWCVFTYRGPTHLGYLKHSLGCTKFSAELQREVSITEAAGGDYDISWQFIDMTMAVHLDHLGYKPNCHGTVKHLHDYASECDQYTTFKWGCSVNPDRSYQLYRNNPDGTCSPVEAK